MSTAGTRHTAESCPGAGAGLPWVFLLEDNAPHPRRWEVRRVSTICLLRSLGGIAQAEGWAYVTSNFPYKGASLDRCTPASFDCNPSGKAPQVCLPFRESQAACGDPDKPPPGPRAAEPVAPPLQGCQDTPAGLRVAAEVHPVSVAAGQDPPALALLAGGESPPSPRHPQGHLASGGTPTPSASQLPSSRRRTMEPRTRTGARAQDARTAPTARPRAGPAPGRAPSRRSPAHTPAARPAAPAPPPRSPRPGRARICPPRAPSAHPPRRGRSRRGLRPGSEGGARGVGPRGRTEPAPRPQQPAFRRSAHPAARRLKGQARLPPPPRRTSPPRGRAGGGGGGPGRFRTPRPAPPPSSAAASLPGPRGASLCPRPRRPPGAPRPGPPRVGCAPSGLRGAPSPCATDPGPSLALSGGAASPGPTQPCLPVLTGGGPALASAVGAAGQAPRLSPSPRPDSVPP